MNKSTDISNMGTKSYKYTYIYIMHAYICIQTSIYLYVYGHVIQRSEAESCTSTCGKESSSPY